MTATAVLTIALADIDTPPLRPLPAAAAELLHRLDAPPRLVAHLRAVHEVAAQLTAWMAEQHPAPDFDAEAVLFGAATHDIGKTLHPAELSGPGSAHEEAGRELLLALDVPPGLARFAATHAVWGGPGVDGRRIGVEDLLVSLADKVWKNKRVPELEDLLVAELVAAGGRDRWEVFLALDDVLTRIGDGAEDRLAYQAAHPVVRPGARLGTHPGGSR